MRHSDGGGLLDEFDRTAARSPDKVGMPDVQHKGLDLDYTVAEQLYPERNPPAHYLACRRVTNCTVRSGIEVTRWNGGSSTDVSQTAYDALQGGS